MTSFKILAPDIPIKALVVTPSATFDVDYPTISSFYGMSASYSQLAANGSSYSITFDLGTGNSRTIDHLVLGGVDGIKSIVSSVKVEGSNNGSTWTDQLGRSSTFTSCTFEGPYGDDVIFTKTKNDNLGATLAAYRYFRFTLTASSATTKLPLSKLFFGAEFDMGFEPTNYNMEVLNEQDADTWEYSRGHYLMTKAFYPKHRITAEWFGVSDAKANEFASTILDNPYNNSVYLYTDTFKDPLYDIGLMYCRVVSDQCTITKANDIDNWNDITVVFEEI